MEIKGKPAIILSGEQTLKETLGCESPVFYQSKSTTEASQWGGGCKNTELASSRRDREKRKERKRKEKKKRGMRGS